MDKKTFSKSKSSWCYYFHPPEFLAKNAIAITGAGHNTQDHSCRVVNRRYPDHTFVLCRSDGASMYFRGKHYQLEKFDCFFIPQMEIHTYGPDPGRMWESYWVSFKSNEALGKLWDQLGSVRRIADVKLQELFDQINLCSLRNAVQEEYSAILFNMLAVLRAPQRSGIASENDTIIERSHNFIINNLERNLTLDEIAENAGFSSTHFSRLFKKRYGMAVNEYIIGRRIAKAQLLLAQTQLPVKEISFKCGFNDQLYFSRIFKKKLHITPSDFRKYYRQGWDEQN